MVISGQTRVGPKYWFAVFDIPRYVVLNQNSYSFGCLASQSTIFLRTVFRGNYSFLRLKYVDTYFHIIFAVSLLLLVNAAETV